MRLLSYMTPGFPASLFEKLGAVVGAEVLFDQTTSGPTPDADPFADGSADLGWICSTSYVDLATRGEDPTVQLVGLAWVPEDPGVNGRPVYFGDLVTSADCQAETLEDLAGKRIGCNDVVSLSGHYALRFALADRGLDPETFAELVFTGAHHTSLDLLLAGELDAAVIDSVVRTGRSRQQQEVADLRVIDRLGPWPVQPLVARASMPVEQVQEVRRLLLEAASQPEIREELAAASLAGLVEVGPDHYDAVHVAMNRGE